MVAVTVGVLALQGAFAEHEIALRRAADALGWDVTVRAVRLPRDLEGLDGLIVPGGESTAIGKLLVAYDLVAPIRAAAGAGLPVWGTCAGMILLADEVTGGAPEGGLGLMDLTVCRNAFGRQLDSFETPLTIQGLDEPVPTVFIRAPVVERVGAAAQVLATLPDGRVVAVRQGRLLATAFHPELTDDPRLHAWFLRELVVQHARSRLPS